MTSTNVDDGMSRHPYYATPEMSVKDAEQMLKDHKIRHLPVILGHNKLVGIISERNVREARALEHFMDLKVEQVMITNPFKVKKGTSLQSVVQVMADKKYGCTVVEDDEGRIAGIFTTTDALRILALLLQGPDDFNLKASIDDFIDYDRIYALSG